MGVRLAPLLLLLPTLACCAERTNPAPTTSTQDTARTVVVTDPHLACLIDDDLEGDATVTVIAPPDPTAHATSWSPDRTTARTLRNADLVITTGAGTDAWLDLLGLRDDRRLTLAPTIRDRMIAIGTDTHSHGPAGEHSHTVYAPRPWLAPDLARQTIDAITSRLTREGLIDPVAYDDTALRARLTGIRAMLDEARADSMLVTTHEEWRYAAESAGISVAVVEDGSDPVWIRVEVTAANAQRVILAGDIDTESVREALDGSGIEITALTLDGEGCSWLDALEAFAKALTGGR